MPDFDPALTIVSFATVLSVLLGGLSLGYFLALSNGSRPLFRNRRVAFTSALVMGFSFLVPLMTARLSEGSPNWVNWIGVLVLWVIFAAASVIGNMVAVRRTKD